MHNKKTLKNTWALYLRQIVIVLISLNTLRTVLTELGVEDYGIYSVVAGFVTLLVFLPGTMASATQRFFSFAMGQQDRGKLKQTFSLNWLLYAAIAALAFFIVLQSIGLWFVTEYLAIAENRTDTAVLNFVAALALAAVGGDALEQYPSDRAQAALHAISKKITANTFTGNQSQ